MKKILFLMLCFFGFLTTTYASNNIYSIDIKVYIDEYGNADIEEVWDVEGSDGSEWYKVLGNLGNSEISNYEVYMDNKPLTYKKWNVDGNIFSKRGYYGINNGNELCFGKYDYGRHKFKLKYRLSNFIFNVEDAQVIYFNFIDKLSNVNFNNFSLELSTYNGISNDVKVWGYGHYGKTYIANNKIKMSNKFNMNNKYVVLLAKFPLNTFKTNNSYEKFTIFDDVYELAKKNTNIFKIVIYILIFILVLIIGVFILIKFISRLIVQIGNLFPGLRKKNIYSYSHGKKISKKNTPYYREIPCNKNIYLADTLLYLNGLQENDCNIMGALFLKWINEGILKITSENGYTKLILKKDVKFSSKNELGIYSMLEEASNDGILEEYELKKWCVKNPGLYMRIFNKIRQDYISELTKKNYIVLNEDGKTVLGENIYNESLKLYGLKLFLDDFSNIKDRKLTDMVNWQDYLMFACVFGNAKKLMEQLKNLYPEVISELNTLNIDYDVISAIENISLNAYAVARNSYSLESIAEIGNKSGGGGFSSSSGGGGAFGGGGGGSR